MNAQMSQSYALQLDGIGKTVRAEWRWPSASAGFSCYLSTVSGISLPLGCGVTPLSLKDIARLDEAPVLASVGYAMGTGLLQDTQSNEAWRQGIERLRYRNAFMPDRESFVYRPFELLGIVLGIVHCAEVTLEVQDWIRVTLRRAENEVKNDKLFNQLVSSWAASLGGVAWRKTHLPTVTDLSTPELALAYWLSKHHPELLTEEQPTNNSLSEVILARLAVTAVSESDAARSFLIYSSLRNCVEQKVTNEKTPMPSATSSIKLTASATGLREALQNKKATVIVGAGVSRASANLCGWNEVIRAAVAFLTDKGVTGKSLTTIEPLMDDGLYEQAAQIVEHHLKAIGGKADFLRRQFHVDEQNIQNRALVETIWRVAGNVVFTTNYDRILQICGPSGIETVTWQEPDKMLAALRGDGSVVHIHGVFNKPDSVVFSSGDYARLNSNEAYKNFAQTLWTKGPLLFIGASSSGVGDSDFSRLFSWGRTIVPDSPFTSYVLQIRGANTPEEKTRLYRDFKLEVVEYGDSHADLGPFLQYLI